MSELIALRKQLERERQARRQAEKIMEEKSKSLFDANIQLRSLNQKLEKDFSEAEQTNQNLLDTIPDIVFRFDLKGHFTFINQHFEEVVGYKADYWIGRHFKNLIAYEQRDKLQSDIEEWLKSSELNFYTELQAISASRKKIWLGLNARKSKSLQGEQKITGVARDISHRMEIELALKKARLENINKEHKYRNIIENMKLGLLEVTNDGVISLVNDIFCTQSGYRAEELIGQSANDVLIKDAKYVELIDQQSIRRQSGTSDIYETCIRHKNGDPLWMMISATPLYDLDNKIIGSVGIHYDISAMKKLQNDLLRAKEEAENSKLSEQLFLANMSHEIRTPLNGIIGMTHLIKETPLNDEQLDLIHGLSSSSDLLYKLINNILDLSKLESGKLQANSIQFDLKHLAKSTSRSFSSSINKSTTFNTNIEEQLHPLYIGDELMLSQVIFNLIGNASKFTKKGKIEFSVRIVDSNSDADCIRFEIKDSGIGISKNNLNRIFEKYDQASNDIRTKYGGTGLGLPISKKLVELMRGELKVTSVEGEGSTFFFDLWMTKCSDISKVTFIKNDAQSFINTAYPILVVDDNEMNVKYVTKLLDKWNIQYDIAHDGNQAVRLSEGKKYSLILMDIQMPVLDGFEASVIIRDGSPLNRSTPIIALTAASLSNQMEKARSVGMEDFLSKPFSPDQLLRILHIYLDENNDFEHVSPSSTSFEYNANLDTQYLNETYGEDLEYALDMFETFLQIIPIEINRLEASAELHDFEDCRRTAHKIKPTFTMVGLSDISHDCKTIETLIQKQNHNEATTMIYRTTPKMRTSLDTIELEVQKIKKHINQKAHAHSNSR